MVSVAIWLLGLTLCSVFLLIAACAAGSDKIDRTGKILLVAMMFSALVSTVICTYRASNDAWQEQLQRWEEQEQEDSGP